MNREWLTQAACAGMADATYAEADPFHPEPNRGKPDYREARSICEGCPVRQACLADAMATETKGERAGFRGGLTPDERQALYRRGIRGTATPDDLAVVVPLPRTGRTTCDRQHDWSIPGTLHIRPNGRRICVPCERIRDRRKKARQRLEAS